MAPRRLALGLAAVALLSACSSVPTDSGIAGTVTIGPTQPVATPGSTNSQPYSAELVFAPEGGAHLKRPATVKSAEDGTFRVNLAPGTYVIQAAETQGGPPTLAPITVVVEPHQFAEVEVGFDSGIR